MFYLNRLTSGALGTVQTFWEPSSCFLKLKCALKGIEQVTPISFSCNGPLVRSLPQYSVYTLSEKDLKSIFDDDKTICRNLWDYLTRQNSNITIKDGNAR